MKIALWTIQILLAVIYGMIGFREVFQTEKLREQMAWAKEESSGSIRFVGTSELLGAADMILPMLTGILPWLTPLAAIGFGFIQFLAIFTVHLPRNDYNILPLNIILLALSIFVVVGRWALFISSFHFL
jgi:uncharacterized membrane protein YphA (DoxX/SURF4 family)